MASIDPGDALDRLLETHADEPADPRPTYSPARLVEDVQLILNTVGVRVEPPDLRLATVAAEDLLRAIGVRPDPDAPGLRAKQGPRPTPTAARCRRCGEMVLSPSDHSGGCPDAP